MIASLFVLGIAACSGGSSGNETPIDSNSESSGNDAGGHELSGDVVDDLPAVDVIIDLSDGTMDAEDMSFDMSGDEAGDDAPREPVEVAEDTAQPPTPFTMDARSWSFYEVNTIGGGAIYPDLTMGLNDQPVLAFRRGERVGGLMEYWPVVATFDGVQWSAPDMVERESQGTLGKRPSIAVDSSGTFHVLSYDEWGLRPHYAVQEVGSEWDAAPIYNDDVDAGDHSCLFLDSSGTLHATFLQYTDYRLVYGTLDGAAWTFDIVEDDDGPVRGSSSSLVVDSDGTVHIAFYSAGALYYTIRTGDDWDVEIVDDTVDNVGHYPSLALDPDGVPWITYLRWPNELTEARVAHRLDGGTWDIDILEGSLGIAYTTGIAALADGTILAVFPKNDTDTGSGELRFGYLQGGDDVWEISSVDTRYYVSGIDIAVGGDDRIHIAYYDESGYVLRHAVLGFDD